MNVGLEVTGVNTEGASDANGGYPTAMNEQVDEGAADVEDLSYFMEVEQTRLHAASGSSRRQW